MAAAPIKGFRAPGVTELTDQPQSVDRGGPGGQRGADRHQGGAGRDLRRRTERQRLVGHATRRPGRHRLAAPQADLVDRGGSGRGRAHRRRAGAAFESQVFTPSHPVPTLVDLPLAKAQAAVSKLHMTLKEGAPVKSIAIAAGSVVSQSPKAGTSLKEGSTITVRLSDGPPNVAVPNLANMTCAQAAATLQTVHLNATCTPGAYNDNVAGGAMIISWSIGNTPNPTEAPYGQHHHHRALARPSPATVPNIPTTYTFAQAQAALQAVGLTATQANDTSTTVAAGDVISTTPASGASAPFGSAVTVTVSTGPPTTKVPNVIGDTVNQATTALQAAGLAPAGVSGNPRTTWWVPNPPSGRPCRPARPCSSSPH